jgi:hypothetical protein
LRKGGAEGTVLDKGSKLALPFKKGSSKVISLTEPKPGSENRLFGVFSDEKIIFFFFPNG